MRLSLRSRVLALVFGVNVAVFGASGFLTLRSQVDAYERQDDQLIEDLISTLTLTIRESGLNVPRILAWPNWKYLEDVILVDSLLERLPSGRIEPRGIALNPVGRPGRSAAFDEQVTLTAIESAILTRQTLDGVQGGSVVPIEGPSGAVWGGMWFRPTDRVDEAALVRTVVQWFALSTLVLTLMTFFGMRRLVLDPVASLGEGARRVKSGDFSVRLVEPARRDELADLVRSFNVMTSQVQGFNDRLAAEVEHATAQARQAEAAAMTQRRLAAMGELAAGIAHEINNPLGGLLNAIKTLERDDLEPARRARYLELLSTGLIRIGETVNRLRRFTPRATEFETIDLVDVTRDSLDLVRHRCDRLGVTLEASGLETPAPISGARNEIGQAVLNLLANALDSLEERGTGGRVAVTLAAGLEPGGGDRVGITLSVRDDGPGVGPEELERVQDLFYTTKEVGKGTGLGLALVHNTVQQHGGYVRIQSERGSFFEVRLWFPGVGSEGAH